MSINFERAPTNSVTASLSHLVSQGQTFVLIGLAVLWCNPANHGIFRCPGLQSEIQILIA